MARPTLTDAVNEVNDAKLFSRGIPASRRKSLAGFIAGRQGLTGAYSGLFAPVEGELDGGYVLPTGERITTRGGAMHTLGEEALRALVLLTPATKAEREAIARAAEVMGRRLDENDASSTGDMRRRGTYCCIKCSVALWRALSVGAFADSGGRLRAGMKTLRGRRDGKGGWRGFPFNYTISALLEANTDEAASELVYASPSIERRLNRLGAGDDPVSSRRRRLYELALQVG